MCLAVWPAIRVTCLTWPLCDTSDLTSVWPVWPDLCVYIWPPWDPSNLISVWPAVWPALCVTCRLTWPLCDLPSDLTSVWPAVWPDVSADGDLRVCLCGDVGAVPHQAVALARAAVHLQALHAQQVVAQLTSQLTAHAFQRDGLGERHGLERADRVLCRLLDGPDVLHHRVLLQQLLSDVVLLRVAAALGQHRVVIWSNRICRQTDSHKVAISIPNGILPGLTTIRRRGRNARAPLSSVRLYLWRYMNTSIVLFCLYSLW